MDAFLGAFLEVISWPLVGYLFSGCLIGLVFGIIPGVTGIVLFALLLPLCYTIDFSNTIVMMTALFAVGVTSDTIPTILFGLPPTASASATLLDGHSLAVKGEPARALGASYTSSILGGLIGALALGLTVPILRPVVLSFGTPEVFMVCLWGLTMLASLSSGSLTKGLIAGFIGILMGTVGRSPTSGIYRFTFNIPYLIEGIKIVPVALGLFAIPEIIKFAIGTEKGPIQETAIRGNLFRGQLQGMRDVFRHWFLLIRASLIGVWIGIVPGVGSATADWFAYAHAVQTAKDRSQFGKGDIRGIIAPEAGNNSCKGGDLIPTLAFGVPGSSAMALLLGSFYMAGVHPGLSLLTTNVGITYKIVWALALSNVIGGGICLLFTSQIAKILYLPKHYIVSVMTPFLILAVFMGTQELIDIVVLILFGLLGFGMKRYGWARPPMIVGFVLSSITEWNFVITLKLHRISFLTRPIVIGLIVIFVLNQVWASLRERRIAREVKMVKEVEDDEI